LDTVEDGCWVNLTYPSEDELNTVTATLGVDGAFLRAALDEEESARIERNDAQTLLIVDMPYVEAEGNGYSYSTIPMG
ncbi:MAG: CorA family divalent cation transporter, partial [Oscillospiraceae bacterium]